MMHVSRTWRIRLGGGLFFLFMFLQIAGIFFHVGDGIFRFASRMIVPPVYASGSFISYHRVVETAHAFVALGVAENYDRAFPLALSFSVRDAQIRFLLSGKEIVSADVFSSEDQEVLSRAGISAREQERYLLLPFARLREASVLSREMLPSQEGRMQNILEKISLGMPFADIARYFSEDVSALHGGDLGVFMYADLPEWAKEAAQMQVGDVRNDFVGADSFWILKVVDAGGVGDGAWVHLRGIALAQPTLGAVLRAHAQTSPPRVFIW